MENIRIGTLVPINEHTGKLVEALARHGFESVTFTYWQEFNGFDPATVAKEFMPFLKKHDIKVSAISLFANPLEANEAAQLAATQLRRLMDCADAFECDLISGFTGRQTDVPIDRNIERFKEVWTPLAEYAEAKKLKIAWENCNMGGNWQTGSWNIAQNPAAWSLMFDAIPMDNVGLEWEPCHQMVQLIDPLPQLEEWTPKIFHVHGKDATIRRDLLAKYGFGGAKPFSFHRTPGFGDSNWTDIISELRRFGYRGAIDIEGYHDPVYRGEWEMTGQVAGLNYLKRCRGGEPIANP